MKNKIAEVIKYFGNFLLKLSKLVHLDVQEKRANIWYAQKNHNKLRFEYDLTSNSIVFDLGGYEGQWASDIYSMYRCKIYIFEPVKLYADEIKNRFKNNDNIYVFPFGLADKTEKSNISLLNDSSSVFKNDANSQEIELVSFRDFIEKNNITYIDLMKINIEGGEFPLLEDITNDSIINKINNIQIQFHDFVDNADVRMKNIQTKLAKSHFTTYQIEYIWENWKLK